MPTARRRVLRSLASAPLLPAAWAHAQVAPVPSPSVTPPVPSTSPASPAASPSPAAPDPVAEALADVVRQRYGSQLGAEDLAEVRKVIEQNLSAADRLKQVRLGNGDEPVTLFQAEPPGAAAPPRR
jgi:hypothetical protein